MSKPLIPLGEATADLDTLEVEATFEKTTTEIPKTLVATLQPLIAKGATVEEAAAEKGIVWDNYSKATRTVVKELLKGYQMPADVVREVIRATRTKIILEGINATGENEIARKKLALEAAKHASSDPDIGLNQPPQIAVNIDMRSIQELAKDLEVPEGFERPE